MNNLLLEVCYKRQINFFKYFYSNKFLQAFVVLGQFLVLKKDEEMFKDWLKETCGANANQGGNCYECLKEWSEAFI